MIIQCKLRIHLGFFLFFFSMKNFLWWTNDAITALLMSNDVFVFRIPKVLSDFFFFFFLWCVVQLKSNCCILCVFLCNIGTWHTVSRQMKIKREFDLSCGMLFFSTFIFWLKKMKKKSLYIPPFKCIFFCQQAIFQYVYCQ